MGKAYYISIAPSVYAGMELLTLYLQLYWNLHWVM